MINFNDGILTLIACLAFIMIFLFLFKMHISNNKALLNKIDQITSDKSIKIKSNYKELTHEDFAEIIIELKKINYYPEIFIEIECGYCKNISMSIVKGIPKAIGIETSKKNVKRSREILEKLPKSLKNISVEYQELDNLNLPIIENKTLLLINNQNYSEELNNKILEKIGKNIVLILNKIPDNCNMKILKKSNNYFLLNNNI